MSPRFAPAYYHVPTSKQNQRTKRVIRLTVHTCALCMYRKYRTGTYSAERCGRTVVKRVNTWGRRVHMGPSILCTRRESMRVQVRKSTVVRRRGGGSVEKKEREMAWPKVKPNSFSVRLEAADFPLISLSRVSSRSSLSAFSLYAYYIRERMCARMMLSYVCFYSERRFFFSFFWRLRKSLYIFNLLLLS